MMKRNVGITILLASMVMLSACGSNSSSGGGGNGPQGPQKPLTPGGVPIQNGVSVQGTAFGANFTAASAIAILGTDTVTLLLSPEASQPCSNVIMGSSGINFTLPLNAAGPFLDGDLMIPPQYVSADLEAPALQVGVRDFTHYNLNINSLTDQEIEVAVNLSADDGSLVSGVVKAKLCQ